MPAYRHAPFLLATALLANALLAATGMAGDARDAPSTSAGRYQAWLDAGHRDLARRHEAHLRAAGVAAIVPPAALARTSRSWRRCGDQEFAIAPEALWPNMPPTLRAVSRLRDAGLLDPALARSVYRDAAMNACAGGSARSRHRDNGAIDFDLPASADNITRLCAFWREHGPALRLGLGFYSATTIHLDTAGFRTWGRDHHRGTSLCIAPPGTGHQSG